MAALSVMVVEDDAMKTMFLTAKMEDMRYQVRGIAAARKMRRGGNPLRIRSDECCYEREKGLPRWSKFCSLARFHV